jgi:hypothetical protein
MHIIHGPFPLPDEDSKIVALSDKIASPQDTLDLAISRLKENPDIARDGLVVIMLDRGPEGDSYNIYQVSSDMRRMQLAALLEAAKFEQLKAVLG